MKIEMTRDFSWNGTPLKKGKVLTVHTAFKKNDIDPGTAEALKAKGVAKDYVEPKKNDHKSADSRPAKK